MARIIKTFSVILLVLFVFTGCTKKEDKQDLSFTAMSDFLVTKDTAFRTFSETLKQKNEQSEDYELLEATTDYIEQLSSSLVVQFDEYEQTLANFNSIGDSSTTTITKSTTTIQIITPTQKMEVFLSEEGDKASILFSSSETFYVYEIVVVDGAYLGQMVIKRENENYTIYKYKFNGTEGKLSINYSTSYDGILNCNVLYSDYSVTGDSVFVS